MRRVKTLRALAAALLVVGVGGVRLAHAADPPVDPGPTPRAQCGPGSKPETAAQGRVPAADVASGRAAQGYTCNAELLSHYGRNGGYRVHRYVDGAGHECAFYDSTLLFPTNTLSPPGNSPGVYVLDMADPAHPVRTAALTTPAMLSPHESLSLNTKRGLLVADLGNPITAPGWVDIYDVSQDCRHPVLKSSTPLGILGHEGTFSPDGNTFWVSSTGGHTITALDISNPTTPVPLWLGTQWVAHGMNVSDDGNRLYVADIANFDPTAGLTILDVSQVQQRKPNPQVKVVSHLSWPEVSVPQTAIPVTINGHPYLVEVDEFARQVSSDPKMAVGAARIIDIADDTKPKVVSNIRLEANMPANRTGDERNDPGASSGLQGYAAHYCAVPSRVEPGVVACSFILSGMRLFDIRDPLHPKELAYANFVGASSQGGSSSAYAMSAPTFVPNRGEIWYSDGNSGFYALRVTNGVWPFPVAAPATARSTAVLGASASRTPPASRPSAPAAAPSAQLAVTGGEVPVSAAGIALVVGLALRRLRRHAVR
jgi:hypothetical protein